MGKEFKTRVQPKCGTKAEWDKATTFVPLRNELIVYTDIGQFKIGDGVNTVGELPFKDEEYSESEISNLYNN